MSNLNKDVNAPLVPKGKSISCGCGYAVGVDQRVCPECGFEISKSKLVRNKKIITKIIAFGFAAAVTISFYILIIDKQWVRMIPSAMLIELSQSEGADGLLRKEFDRRFFLSFRDALSSCRRVGRSSGKILKNFRLLEERSLVVIGDQKSSIAELERALLVIESIGYDRDETSLLLSNIVTNSKLPLNTRRRAVFALGSKTFWHSSDLEYIVLLAANVDGMAIRVDILDARLRSGDVVSEQEDVLLDQIDSFAQRVGAVGKVLRNKIEELRRLR